MLEARKSISEKGSTLDRFEQIERERNDGTGVAATTVRGSASTLVWLRKRAPAG